MILLCLVSRAASIVELCLFLGSSHSLLSQGRSCGCSSHEHSPGAREGWSTLWVTATAGCGASC